MKYWDGSYLDAMSAQQMAQFDEIRAQLNALGSVDFQEILRQQIGLDNLLASHSDELAGAAVIRELEASQRALEHLSGIPDLLQQSIEAGDSVREAMQQQLAGSVDLVAYQETLPQIRQVLDQLGSPQLLSIQEVLQRSIPQEIVLALESWQQVETWIEELEDSEVAYSDDGLVVDGEVVYVEELDDVLASLEQEEGDDEETELDLEALFKRVDALEQDRPNQSSSRVRRALQFILITIVLNIFGNLLTPLVKSLLPGQKPVKVAERLVKEQMSALDIPTAHQKHLRLVTVHTLYVRAGPSRKEHKVGKLHLGQTVILLKKGRHWSLVRWSTNTPDGDPIIVQGWVFSRYLQNISKKRQRRSLRS